MSDKNKICRSFRQDFPEFVDRADALGVRIQLGEGRRNGRERVFWLDGYRQLTGYTTKSDGSRFTHADAVANIDRALSAIEEDRKAVCDLSVAERFSRVMSEMRKFTPQYRMIGEARMPCGDVAHCFFFADYNGGVSIFGIGEVARASAGWVQGESSADHLARFCDALEADFNAGAFASVVPRAVPVDPHAENAE